MPDSLDSLFGSANLPDTGNLGTALRTLAAMTQQDGPRPFLKLRKGDGQFVYGPEETEVPATDEWAINFMSFKIGLIGWKGGQVVGEQMFPVTSPEKPDTDNLEPIESSNPSDGWKKQISVEMKRIRDGQEVIFKTTSYGGQQMMSKLMEVIGNQLASKPDAPIVVVTLGSESYPHKTYGKIFNPVFNVVGWRDANGKEVGEAPAQLEARPPLV